VKDDDSGPVACPGDYGFREWQPRIWNGMTVSAIRSLLAGKLSRVSPRRYPLLLSVVATACINSMAVRLSGLKQQPPAQSPIFILGFWRSGTTWLHDLLAADPRHVAPTTVQCLFPRSFPVAEFLAPVVDRLIPKGRPMDAMAVAPGSPQEDEFAVLNAGLASPYRYFAFPSAMAEAIDSAGCWPDTEDERMAWLGVWRRFIDQVAFRSGGKRLVLKSPAHTGRIAQILKIYPDAKFVHISRDPKSLLASNLNMFAAFTATQTFEARIASQAARTETIFRLFRRVYDAYFAERGMIPTDNLLEIAYEDLINAPAATTGRVYSFLQGEEAIPAEVTSMIEARRDYRPGRHQALADELLGRLQMEWADYSRAFGYQT
jgi:LPS sulfotransferase NodH